MEEKIADPKWLDLSIGCFRQDLQEDGRLFPAPSTNDAPQSVLASSEVLTSKRKEAPSDQEDASLVICYSGKVFRYESVPEQQANAIMRLASQKAASHLVLPAISRSVSSPSASSSNAASKETKIDTRNIPESAHIIPSARKASLLRFLQKRKERSLAAKACSEKSEQESSHKNESDPKNKECKSEENEISVV